MNNATLVPSNAKLTAEVANLTKRLGKNTGGKKGGKATNKRSPTTCTNCKKYGFHKPDDCFELEKNLSKRSKNWNINL